MKKELNWEWNPNHTIAKARVTSDTTLMIYRPNGGENMGRWYAGTTATPGSIDIGPLDTYEEALSVATSESFFMLLDIRRRTVIGT